MSGVADLTDGVAAQWQFRGVSARFVLNEAAGSLGDLGTFVPLVVGLVQIVGLDAGTVLVFAGLMNVITGLVFRIPIAVQPMKAIAMLAIGGALSATQVSMAGSMVGLAVLVSGVFGIMKWLDRVIPRPVLRGLQATVAFQLVLSGARLGLCHPGTYGLRPMWGPSGLIVFAAALVTIALYSRRLPWAALLLTAVGLFGAYLSEPGMLKTMSITVWQPKLALPEFSAIGGALLGGLPQMPLTLLNSVLAVSLLAGQLFPENGKNVAPAKVAVSVGLMNLIACPFGGMPMCHGSGGLAAQYRFGARSCLSMVMLGSAKLTVGLLFGAAAVTWMKAFPTSILGMFLVIAGVQLASASRCWDTRRGLITGCVMVGVQFATGVLVLSCVSGWIAYALLPKEHTSFSGGSNGAKIRSLLVSGESSSH